MLKCYSHNLKPLKIAKITTLLDFGGQEKQFISFTESPKILINNYLFAAIGHGGNAEKEIRKRGFKIKIFNKNPAIRNLINIWILYKWFRKEKPDIVHTAAAEANFHGVIAAKLAGVKKIYAEEIGIPNHSKSAKFIFKLVYKWTDGVICVSRAVKENLIAIGEIEENKGIAIYNPVSIPKSYNKIPSDKFHFVYVGRLEKVKNVILLVNAFAQLKEKDNCLLTIIGDGRERNNIENLITALSLNSLINLVGFSDEPEKYVSQADLFVLPSFSEGFGIAAVEAMYLGVPCLCTKIGGIPEFIIDGENGWLFDPYNEDELVFKMEHIFKLEKHVLNKIGQKGKEYTLNNFTIEKYIISLEEIYKKRVKNEK